MTKFIRLVDFEFNRIFKFIIGLMIFIFIFQLASVMFEVFYYKKYIISKGFNLNEILDSYGAFSFNYISMNIFFFLPLFIAVSLVGLYLFFIWYRDWFGKNTFIYRLLMLPLPRMNVFFAKLMTLMIALLSIVLTQFMFLFIYQFIIRVSIPIEYQSNVLLTDAINGTYLQFFLPTNPILFFIEYISVICVVMILFTVILLERSYHLLGLLIGIGYLLVVSALIFLPIIVQFLLFNDLYFYPEEMMIYYVLLWFILVSWSFIWSKKLLDKKITV